MGGGESSSPYLVSAVAHLGSAVRKLQVGLPLETRPLEVECISPEPSQGSGETDSSSIQGDTDSSSTEESLSDECSVVAPGKRAEWVEPNDAVGEKKWEAGFEPVLGRRAGHRLAKRDKQRESERVSVEQQAKEEQQEKEDRLLQQKMARAAKERQEAEAKEIARAGKERRDTEAKRDSDALGERLVETGGLGEGGLQLDDVLPLRPHLAAQMVFTWRLLVGMCHDKTPADTLHEMPGGSSPRLLLPSGAAGIGGCSLEEGRTFFMELLKEWQLSAEEVESLRSDWKCQLGF